MVVQKRLFWGLFLINFSITLGFGLTDTFFSIYLVSLGAQGALFALSVSAYTGAKIICGPLIGLGLEHWGQRKTLFLSLCLFLLVSCGYLFISNLYLMIILRLLQGIACAMFRPVVLDLLQQILPENSQAKILGTFDISFYCALGFGQMIGGIIKQSWGFQGLFSTLIVLCLLAMIFCCYTLNNLYPQTSATKRQSVPATALRDVFCRRPFLGLLIYIFGRSYGISVLIIFLPILLTTQLGLNDTRIGLTMGMSTLTLIFLLRSSGQFSDFISPRISMTLGGLIAGALLFIVPLTHSFPQALVIMISMGISTGISQPATTALLVSEGRLLGMGHATGIFNSIMNLGFICGSLAGTALLKYATIDMIFFSAAGLGILSVLVFWSLSPEPENAINMIERYTVDL